MAQEFESDLNEFNESDELFPTNAKDFILGSIKNNGKISEFKLTIQDLLDNIIICGDVYSGKSSVIKRLLLQIINTSELNPIVFDDNNEYNKLIDSRYSYRESWTIEFGNENFTINPLEIVKNSNEEYLDLLIDIFMDTFNLNTEESFILKEIISVVIKENSNPTLYDLKLYLELKDEIIKIFPDELEASIAHLRTILTALTCGPIKKILDVEKSNLHMANLQDFPIFIKFNSISHTGRKFIKNLIYLNQIIYKKNHQNTPPHLLVIDSIDDITFSLVNFSIDNTLNQGILTSLSSPFNENRKYIKLFKNTILLHISSDVDSNLISQKFKFKVNLEKYLKSIEMGSSIVKFFDTQISNVEIEDFYF